MSQNFISGPALAGIVKPNGRAVNMQAPITASATVANLLVTDAVELASLFIPLTRAVQHMAPVAVGTQIPRGFALLPAATGSWALGDLAFSGVTASVIDFDPAVTGSHPVSITFTTFDDTVVPLLSATLSPETLAATLYELVRMLTTGVYASAPQLIRAIQRGGYTLDASAEALILEASDDSIVRMAAALGIDTRPQFVGGAISNPASRLQGAANARTMIGVLETEVWPTMHEWLLGNMAVNLSALSTA